jgi:hypothetical protein
VFFKDEMLISVGFTFIVSVQRNISQAATDIDSKGSDCGSRDGEEVNEYLLQNYLTGQTGLNGCIRAIYSFTPVGKKQLRLGKRSGFNRSAFYGSIRINLHIEGVDPFRQVLYYATPDLGTSPTGDRFN